MGNSLATNMFMLGFAYQKGAVPLAGETLERAITLNGEAVAMNLAAFAWGRRMAADPAAVEALVAATRKPSEVRRLSAGTGEMVERRVAFLTAYQNAAYAERYRARVASVMAAAKRATPGQTALGEAVARYLFKLMAVKDEYEVARLYSDGAFAKQVAATFDGDVKLQFHLAPPIFGRKGPDGLPRKTSFGPWMMTAFGLLARMKGLRGGVFDVFGHSAERRVERALICEYEALLDELAKGLSARNHALAVALASIPEKIRGFGHVKARHLQAAKAEEAALLAQWRAGGDVARMAAE